LWEVDVKLKRPISIRCFTGASDQHLIMHKECMFEFLFTFLRRLE
jgi:hypothetical protein